LAAVTAGGGIYLLWRPESLLVFRWIRLAGLEPSLSALRSAAAGIGAVLPGWVIYALWAFALGLFLFTLWGACRRVLVPLAAAGLAAVCLPELLQHPAFSSVPRRCCRVRSAGAGELRFRFGRFNVNRLRGTEKNGMGRRGGHGLD
jgi:hypothetical protein